MPPEKAEKTREEIVRDTGWGVLIPGPTKPTEVKSDQQYTVKPLPSDTPPPSPPPQIDH